MTVYLLDTNTISYMPLGSVRYCKALMLSAKLFNVKMSIC